MTKNQIEYAKLKEMQRSNKASEELTHFRDLSSAYVNFGNLNENIRHNQAVESQAMLDLGIKSENAGANVMNALTNSRNAETNRYNAETNRINSEINQYNADTQRLNYDVNKQNAYTNAYNAQINARNADVNFQNAQTNSRNASINAINAKTRQREADIAQQKADDTFWIEQGKLIVSEEQLALNERDVAVREAAQDTKEYEVSFLPQKYDIEGTKASSTVFKAGADVVTNILGTGLNAFTRLVPFM